MLHNNVYNLINQLTQENKSHWRIKNEYVKDAKGDPEIVAFWKKMEQEKEAHVKELTQLLKKYLS